MSRAELSADALTRLLELARPLVDECDRPLDFLGKYELIRELGRGASGVVYEASYAYGGARWRVAIKLLNDGGFATSAARRRFWSEALAATRLVHPNIVRILEVHSAYLVMQLVDGASLAGARLGPADAARVGVDVARAVAAAHAQGVIHRDLKPANLLCSARSGRVYVTDFGLASCGGDDDGAIVGTPGFMAPEQARGAPVGPTADVYGLGATLRALAGPGPLDAITRRCLAPAPAARPQTMIALAGLLDAAIGRGILGPATHPPADTDDARSEAP